MTKKYFLREESPHYRQSQYGLCLPCDVDVLLKEFSVSQQIGFTKEGKYEH